MLEEALKTKVGGKENHDMKDIGENNNGKTLISEGIKANYQDIVNYSVFCLIKLLIYKE